jgi:hypothetical protein
MWYPEGNGRSFSVLINHCIVEVPLMRWLKGNLRKSDVIIIGVMLLLTLLIVVFALLGWGHQTAPPGQAPGTIATETAKENDAIPKVVEREPSQRGSSEQILQAEIVPLKPIFSFPTRRNL